MAEQVWLNGVQWAVIKSLLPHLGGEPQLDTTGDKHDFEVIISGSHTGCPAV